MTQNEKELILQWLTNIEKEATQKSLRHTYKQQYQDSLDAILAITAKGIRYLNSLRGAG